VQRSLCDETREVKAVKDKEDLPRYPTFLEHVWQRLLKGTGLRYRKFHSTRHTFVTWAAEGREALGIAPAPILAVRDWAGHSSVQETERYFHRVNRRAHARHVDGLDRYVQGDGGASA